MKASYSAQNCYAVILSNIFIFTRDEVLKSMLTFHLEDLRVENQNYLHKKDDGIYLHLYFSFLIS